MTDSQQMYSTASTQNISNEREEYRLIFSLRDYADIRKRLQQNTYEQQSFDTPCNETIYCFSNNYLHLLKHHIRIRRYVSWYTDTLLLNIDSPAFVELKTRRAKNKKLRIAFSSKEAIAILADNHRLSQSMLEQFLPVFPKVATQTYREHFLLTEDIRVTLDNTIRVFKFKDDLTYIGRYIGDLSVGKIEFKFAVIDKKMVEDKAASLLDGFQYREPRFLFMEREMWRIYSRA